MAETNNHKKEDLEKVLCDDLICGWRGDFGECYIHLYKNCQYYQAYLKWRKEQKD